ncbi:MAG: hypothetical protein NT142_13235 [Planctomycetota bacterium]|nr:hypothetical protein [Planctomycetota bacterium]
MSRNPIMTVGQRLCCILLVGFALTGSGCNSLAKNLRLGQPKDSPIAPQSFTAEQMVSYLNDNSRRVSTLQCNNVSIDSRQGDQNAPGLEGLMVLQKPRNFRMKGKVVGQPAVDLGSNNDEFWYWVSKAEPVPYVFHCNYNELSHGQTRMPFPFQPEMVIQALGVSDYDPSRSYQVRDTGKTMELVDIIQGPSGPPLQKITVFLKELAPAGKPQVIKYLLRDNAGKDICISEIFDTQIHRETGAILPLRMKMNWPQERVEMTLRFGEFIMPQLTQDQTARMFQRSDLGSQPSFDLARGMPDAPPTARAP